MCGKEITDVFIEHAEYEPLSAIKESAVGRQLFIFANDNDEYIMYNKYDRNSFVATYTDHQGESHHYRVSPRVSIRVSTLVVNRYGYTLVEDETDLGFMQETAES